MNISLSNNILSEYSIFFLKVISYMTKPSDSNPDFERDSNTQPNFDDSARRVPVWSWTYCIWTPVRLEQNKIAFDDFEVYPAANFDNIRQKKVRVLWWVLSM